jgi:type VI protein secretion system component Hcp
MAAPMLFLKMEIEGLAITGTAENTKFREHIAIDGLSWSVSAKDLSSVPGNKVRGKVEPQVLVIEKSYDRASSTLAQAMLDRKKVRKAVITMLNGEIVGSDGGNPELAIVTAVDGFVEQVDLSTGKSGKSAIEVKETIRVSFRNLTLTYFPGDTKRLGRGAGIDAALDAASVK